MDSIGSYAESLILNDLEGIKEGKKSSFDEKSVAAEAGMPDISKIDLDSNQVEALLLGEEVVPQQPRPVARPIQEAATSDDPIAVLIEQLSYLVEKAESLVSRLDEMTACGSIGVSQKFNLMKSEPFTPPAPPKVMNKLKKLKKYRRR